MSEHKIINAMGNINNKFILEAEEMTRNQTNKKQNSKKPVFISLGSACAAAAAGVVLLNSGAFNSPAIDPVSSPQSAVSSGVSSSEAISSAPSQSEPNTSENRPQETAKAVSNPNIPYKGGEFSIDKTSLPFKYNGGAVGDLGAADLSNDGMGFEGFMAYDVSELAENNPWSERLDITELPAFSNASDGSYKEFWRVYNLAAEKYPEATVELKFGGTIEITFPDAPEYLPEDCCLDSYDGKATDPEKLAATYKTLAEKYADILGYENPAFSFTHDYNIYGEEHWFAYVYEAAENPFDAMISYNFSRAQFLKLPTATNFDGSALGHRFIIRIDDEIENLSCAGFYPVITADEAKQNLLSGRYVSTVPENELKNGVTNDVIKHAELVYHKATSGYTLPYYRFLLELDDDFSSTISEGMNQYGAFYVPAVAPEYLSGDDYNVRFN